jgi:RNA polymerase sigma factor (sigma-70 family)
MTFGREFLPLPTRRWDELARGVASGDPASEEDFVRTFHPQVSAMTAGRIRDRETARELVQEVLMGVIQALRKGLVREPEKLPAFVIGTARNVIRHRLQELALHPTPASLEPDLAAPGSLRSPSPQEFEVEEEERRATARRELQKLKPLDRHILYLTLAEGLKPQEIAREVGLKAEVVRNRKSRALKVIQRKMVRLIRNGRPGHI